MKKLIAFLVLFFVLAATVPIGNVVANDSFENQQVITSEMDEMELESLPSAVSLVGTTHLPPIDNQGGVGCCASNAITYTQFTNAVSQYLHSINQDISWDPSSGSSSCTFSPKFTYNFSGAGTAWVYDVLQDHGCLTLSDSSFYKDAYGGSQVDNGTTVYQDSVSWDVANNRLDTALNYRITNYNQISMSSYNYQLTTTTSGLALLDQIKTAVNGGNVVVTGGYPWRWVYGELATGGTYGNAGESAIVASCGDAAGGHQVAIVGYDDNVTAEIGGVTLTGAFLIANSWGTGWQNDGYVWMMYDAVNEDSEYAALNSSTFFSGAMYITPSKGNKMYPSYNTTANQDLTFTKVGTTVMQGQTYNVFTIYDSDAGGYIAYNTSNTDLSISTTATNMTRWCFLPYETIADWSSYFNSSNYNSAYSNSYWVYAVNRGVSVDGYAYMDAGLGYADSGRGVGIASLNGGMYPEAKSWTLDFNPNSTVTSDVSKLGIKAGDSTYYTRRWSLDQFCFLYWDQDISVVSPDLKLQVEVQAANRESLYIRLYRGTTAFVPALFYYGNLNYHPTYDILPSSDYLTFSGVVNGNSETATFTFSYSDLISSIPAGYDIGDYSWGFQVGARKLGTVTLKSAKLISSNGTVLKTYNCGNGISTTSTSSTGITFGSKITFSSFSVPMYQTPSTGNKVYPSFYTTANQDLIFNKVGTTVYEGDTFNVFTIYDPDAGGYIAYNTNDTTLSISATATSLTYWCFLPYETIADWSYFNDSNYSSTYTGTYWAFAVNRGVGITGYGYMDAGIGYTTVGRNVGIASLNGGAYPGAKSWTLDFDPNSNVTFEVSKLGIRGV